MRKMSFTYVIIGILCFGLFFLNTTGKLPGILNANQVENPGIEVNGVGIEKEVLQQEIDQNLNQLKVQYAEHIEENPEFESQLIQYVKHQVLDNHINQLVLKTNAEKADVKVNKKAIDNQIEQIKSRYPNDKSFKDALNDAGYTIDSYRETLKNQLKIDLYLQQNVETPKVSEQEARQVFNDDSKMFGEDVKFEQVKAQIMQQLEKQKWDAAVHKFVTNLREKADISIYL